MKHPVFSSSRSLRNTNVSLYIWHTFVYSTQSSCSWLKIFKSRLKAYFKWSSNYHLIALGVRQSNLKIIHIFPSCGRDARKGAASLVYSKSLNTEKWTHFLLLLTQSTFLPSLNTQTPRNNVECSKYFSLFHFLTSTIT